MNKTILMGRLVRDPEMTALSSGVNKTVFTVATDGFKNKETGESKSDFHRITAWRQTAEFVNKYFNKGDMILVEGKLTSGEYEKDGTKVYTYEVTADNVSFTGSKKDYDNGQAPAATASPAAPTPAAPQPAAAPAVNDEWADLDL